MGKRVTISPENKRNVRPRVQLTRRYEWADPFEGWARGWVTRNIWRVRHLAWDEDDALQECAIIFHRCKRHYEGSVSHPKWFMALFKQAVAHDWNTFAKRDQRVRDTAEALEGAEWQMGTRSFMHSYLDNLETLMREGTDELRGIIDVLLNAPAELIGANQTLLNRRINRMTGQPEVEHDYKHDYLADMRHILETKPE